MAPHNHNPKVDEYIANAQPFAQPILTHIRDLVHRACPDVEEAIKWGMPFFVYRKVILCNMAGFKEHCSFGFWGKEIAAVLREADAVRDGAMGSLGRLTTLKDLPSDKLISAWIHKAATFVDRGEYTSPMSARAKAVKAPKPTPEMSPEFAAALKKDKKASAAFAAFSPSCRRDYIEWIAEARRPETRDRRIATAVEWIAEGKQRNWKYQNC